MEAIKLIQGLGLKPVKVAEGDDSSKSNKSGFNLGLGTKKISFAELENFTDCFLAYSKPGFL